MSDYCFWILPNGVIVKPESRHILAVVCCPGAFGETKESIRKTFKEQGQSQNSNYEGKAREQVLTRVINRNHVRIRKNQHKRQQNWSLQLYELTDERRAAIAVWAKHITAKTTDKFADVIIHQFKDESKIRTSLDKLAKEATADVKPVIVTQTELLEIYKK
jgi:hypothetical protein